MKIKAVESKTILSAEVERMEASDGCFYASVVIKFKDGSSFEMKLTPRIAVDGIFFKDEDNDNAKEIRLAKL